MPCLIRFVECSPRVRERTGAGFHQVLLSPPTVLISPSAPRFLPEAGPVGPQVSGAKLRNTPQSEWPVSQPSSQRQLVLSVLRIGYCYGLGKQNEPKRQRRHMLIELLRGVCYGKCSLGTPERRMVNVNMLLRKSEHGWSWLAQFPYGLQTQLSFPYILLNMSESCWFDFRLGHWVVSIYLNVPAAVWPGVLPSLNSIEYQKYSRCRALPAREADRLTAICEPIV
jgi:hypothetical protein